MNPLLPDIVVDTRLEVEVYDNIAIHHERIEDANGEARPIKGEERWKRGRPIGSGGFGAVWLHQCVSGRRRGELRAVKELQRNEEDSSSSILRELEAVGKFSQKRYRHCFVQSFGWYETSTRLFLVMEYLDKGDLDNYIHQPIPEPEAASITNQLLEGVCYMHDSGFTHRDMKPQNILVRIPGPNWWVKIADFGTAKRQDPAVTSTAIGSGVYMAPEKYKWYPEGKPYIAPATAADIWAVGLIVWRIISNKLAFDLGEMAPYVILKQPLILESGLEISEECRDFVTKALAGSANERPTCHEAASHPWLQMHWLPDEPVTTGGIVDDVIELVPVSPDLMPLQYGSWTTQETTESRQQIVQGQPGLLPGNPQQIPSVESTSTGTGTTANTNVSSHGVDEDEFEEMILGSYLPGMACMVRKKYAQAEQHFRQALASSVTLSGYAEQRYTATCTFELGECLYHQERYLEAEGYYRTATYMRNRLLGPHHAHTLRSTHHLADVLMRQTKFDEAEGWYELAAAGRRIALGSNHIDTLSSLTGQAHALYLQDKFAAAGDIYWHVCEMRETTLGEL